MAARRCFVAYRDDQMVQQLVPMYEANPLPGNFDPRVVLGGVGSVVRGSAPVFLNAPVVILICGDKRAITGPRLNIGICGQNMNLAPGSKAGLPSLIDSSWSS